MKAITRDRYGPPDVLALVEVPTPEPGDGEVLVRVEAASVNTADLDNLLGRPRIARVGTGLRRPKWAVPGLDVAGTVEAVGPGVTRLRPGDGVWADLFSNGHGAFAEYVCAPQDVFAPKPVAVRFSDAATIPHSAVLALQALRSRGGLVPGQRVLVNGAGGCVGPFAVSIAKASGTEVTAVDVGDKFGVMEAAGADHLIDYTKEDVTRGRWPFDVIVDVAARRSVLAFKRILDDHGRYVQIARTLGGFFSTVLLGALFGGNRTMGVFMWVPNDDGDLAHLGQLLEDGRLTPVIDRVVGLAEVPEALQDLTDGRLRGKVVVAP